jgi:flagellar basal body-associated protein FliL
VGVGFPAPGNSDDMNLVTILLIVLIVLLVLGLFGGGRFRR